MNGAIRPRIGRGQGFALLGLVAILANAALRTEIGERKREEEALQRTNARGG